MKSFSLPSTRPSHGPAVKKTAFTLIELLVVIAIIAILASILFPVFGRARENARRSSCMSNMKQIGLGILQYNQDYDEKYPVAFGYASWRQVIQPYIKSSQLLTCPSNPNNTWVTNGAVDNYPAINVSYAAATDGTGADSPSPIPNGVGVISATPAVPIPMALIQDASRVIEVVESTTNSNRFEVKNPGQYAQEIDNPNTKGYLFAGHLATSNFLFADGHVKSMKPLSTINESNACTTTPRQLNLWQRDNGGFCSSEANAITNLTFATNKSQ